MTPAAGGGPARTRTRQLAPGARVWAVRRGGLLERCSPFHERAVVAEVVAVSEATTEGPRYRTVTLKVDGAKETTLSGEMTLWAVAG